MQIAVIKLGARITWETDAAVGPGEAISICKALTTGGAEVHVFTKILGKDTLHPSIEWHDILEDLDTSNMDVLVIVNGSVNYFGGAEDRAQTLNYNIINNFEGKVVYIMCDPELPLTQIWENVSKKPWGSAYKESDLNITRTDIQVLSQPFDIKLVQERWLKKTGTAPIGGVFHFPMERFPLLNEWLLPAAEPTIDVLYGGTTRGGRRIPNLFKWYFGLPKSLKAQIFGKIDLEDFTKHPKVGSCAIEADAPEFTGMVKYCNVLPKMNSALAHLVTGDPSYELLDIIPQRTYECIAAGNVVFIDSNMDKSRRIYPSGLAHDFLYVASQDEFVERLTALKESPEMRLEIINAQILSTNFDAKKFCTSLVAILMNPAA
jgi:hypothetical protein